MDKAYTEAHGILTSGQAEENNYGAVETKEEEQMDRNTVDEAVQSTVDRLADEQQEIILNITSCYKAIYDQAVSSVGESGYRLAKTYIEEAEHQDGYWYWTQFSSGIEAAQDFQLWLQQAGEPVRQHILDDLILTIDEMYATVQDENQLGEGRAVIVITDMASGVPEPHTIRIEVDPADL